jgi:hypothetical protein
MDTTGTLDMWQQAESRAKLMDRLYRLSPSRAAAFVARQMKDLLTHG